MNELYEEVDIAAHKIKCILKILLVCYSPSTDVEIDNYAMANLASRVNDDISKLFKIITTFPEKHDYDLPDYKTWLIEEVDLSLEESCHILEILEDCYSSTKGMPFSKNILTELMTDMDEIIDRTVSSTNDYCKKNQTTINEGKL